MEKVSNEIIFALFLLGTAGLTGTTITCLRRSHQTAVASGLILAGVIASWILRFGAEEIVLAGLPIIIGSSILCSSMLGRKNVGLMNQAKKMQSMSEV